MEFWVTSEFVMEAMRCRGEREAAISSGVPGGPPAGKRVDPGPLTAKYKHKISHDAISTQGLLSRGFTKGHQGVCKGF